jgi:sugar (pentulose or hexulose) kinase
MKLSKVSMESFYFCTESFLILYFLKGIGSAAELARITGSRAYERFTGPQIKHVYKYQPDVYENTERISLISSFLASLLIGNQHEYNRINQSRL